MQIKVRLKEGDVAVERKALEAIRSRLNVVLHQAAGSIRRRLGEVCTALIQGTPEYQSLLHGELLGELGVPEVESRLHAILAKLRESIAVDVVPLRVQGRRLAGGLQAGMIRSDYEDLLSLSAASYISSPSGEEIRWLDWLIREGDRIVVVGYDAFFDLTAPERQRSRTGLALMRRGTGWHVPAEFAGTEGDNFLLRAFDGAAAEALIARIFREEIERRL